MIDDEMFIFPMEMDLDEDIPEDINIEYGDTFTQEDADEVDGFGYYDEFGIDFSPYNIVDPEAPPPEKPSWERPGILVSACLMGIPCRYDGGNNKRQEILDLRRDYRLVPICPECLGDLPVPRPPAEIIGEKVVNNLGEDVTAQFKLGAERCYHEYIMFLCDAAILKDRSPSCGIGEVYDGTFSHTVVAGDGLTAAELRAHKVPLFREGEIEEMKAYFEVGPGVERIKELKKGMVIDMNGNELEKRFETEMLKNIEEAAKLGCMQKKFKENVLRYGACAAMENILRRGQVSEGYECLENLGRLDLSAEALTVKSAYGTLFNDREVNACFEVLCESKFYK